MPKPLSEWTLIELAVELGDAIEALGANRIKPLEAELARRQAMLDAAEGMYGALVGERGFLGFRTSTVADNFLMYQKARNAAYAAAKE